MESGDFSDNLEIFLNAQYQIKTGSLKDGLQTIQTLRHRIIATGEVKSNRWLIPILDTFLSENEPPDLEQCAPTRVLLGSVQLSDPVQPVLTHS